MLSYRRSTLNRDFNVYLNKSEKTNLKMLKEQTKGERSLRYNTQKEYVFGN